MTFNPLRAMVMTYLHAKIQGQQSVASEDRVETNGQTEPINAVSKHSGTLATLAITLFQTEK